MSARADTLNRRDVAANAQWVVHLDVDALWKTDVADQFIKPLLSKDRVQRELKNIHAAIGVDPTKDLYGATLYGINFKPKQGVLLIRAGLKTEAFEAFLAKQPDYKTSDYHGHQLHSWTDKHHGHKGTVIACVFNTAKSSETRGVQLVIAHRMADMKQGLDVLEGRSPNLADSKSPLVSELTDVIGKEKPVVVIGVRGLDKAALPFKSPVVRQCDRAAVALGEHDGELTLHGQITAKSQASAADMQEVIEGLAALGRLAADKNKELRKVLSAVDVSHEGKTVTVEWHGLFTDVVFAVQQEWFKRQFGK
jgi:hypothetical protein